MRHSLLILITILYLNFSSEGQKPTVFTSDIDHFWQAYDSIQTTQDSLRQLQYIKSLYIDRGTEGLKAFMEARDYSADLWISLIRSYPKFWRSIRPNTLSVKSKASEMEEHIKRLKKIYPSLKEAKLYFTVGGLRSGGTTMEDKVLIGTEIATGTAATDVSEFPNKWLEGVFRTQQAGNIVSLNIHEYIHTQQQGEPQDLLGSCIKEGACDFITELVMGHPLSNNYITYGLLHEKELKERFRAEMFASSYSNWLYNGSSAKTMADLGYFMGYAICKAYYKQAKDKKQAVKTIIELNFSDTAAVEDLLRQSQYYTEPWDKTVLLQQYESSRPYVVRLEPFANGDSAVDASLKELRIIFSKPMDPKGFSINYGPRGKEFAPIPGIGGFSSDGKSFTLKLKMVPDHSYEFLITDKSFKSEDGYPLKPMEVKFKTK